MPDRNMIKSQNSKANQKNKLKNSMIQQIAYRS